MEQRYKDAIAQEFASCVQRTIQRIQEEDGHRPFHRALLSQEALFWSRFERSFSTSFGQSVIERISLLAALSGGATHANTQVQTITNLDENILHAINYHIVSLRNVNSGVRGNWAIDLQSINLTPRSGRITNERVISDLYWVKDGIQNYMSIKTVKPNIDQTAEAKRDLLKLKFNDPTCNTYFGLYYNPYGEAKADYNWSPPQRIFNFHYDQCVLIGREYWDTLGGQGFYDELLEIAQNVGNRTRGLLRF